MRELILKGYELVPEAYRQKFRTLNKTGSKTFTEFVQEKAQPFDRWCASEKIDDSFEKLRELILIEEFKNCLGTDVRTFVNDQKADKLTEAARLADNYSLTHKLSVGGKRPNVFQDKDQSQFQKYIPPQGEFKADIQKILILTTGLVMIHRNSIANKILPFHPLFVITVNEKATRYQNAMHLKTSRRMVRSQRVFFLHQGRNPAFLVFKGTEKTYVGRQCHELER